MSRRGSVAAAITAPMAPSAVALVSAGYPLDQAVGAVGVLALLGGLIAQLILGRDSDGSGGGRLSHA
jgi:hypothetical protein